MLPAPYAQKLSLQINVELVGSQEVLDSVWPGGPRTRHYDVQPWQAGRLTGSPHRPGSEGAGGW
jgi:hypothetical protein